MITKSNKRVINIIIFIILNVLILTSCSNSKESLNVKIEKSQEEQKEQEDKIQNLEGEKEIRGIKSRDAKYVEEKLLDYEIRKISDIEFYSPCAYKLACELVGDELWYIGYEEEKDRLSIDSINIKTGEHKVHKVISTSYDRIYYGGENIWFSLDFSFCLDDLRERAKVPLLRYNLKEGKFYEYTKKELPNVSYATVFENGRYAWVGSEGGIIKIDLKNNSIKTENKYGKYVMSIIGDSERIWIGSIGYEKEGGVKEIDKDGNIIAVYNRSNFLIDNFVVDLILDKHDNLWINWGGDGYEGITFLNLKTKESKHFMGFIDERFSPEKMIDILDGYNGFLWMDEEGIIWATAVDNEDFEDDLCYFDYTINDWRRYHFVHRGSSYTASSFGDYAIIGCGWKNGVVLFNKRTEEFNWINKDWNVGNIFKIGEKEFLLLTNEGVMKIKFFDKQN
ncbi:hypothetical protein Y919_03780 [Caloranaerobacter azorensis H53214]|uniref:Histidine kinase n=1 Tax=Caloranaerobacter azorensis H53214 TaxID=1156417 RepID=A0A096BI39_9FIRM|nr:hypothetical protein [Caloranaerobacter azorensis]KGG80875.1 hypothetical protein Y919_03780 [Caloranaerobacter azorensis H53214]